MPLYTYRNPETGEEVDLVQGMNDIHEFTDENGLKWDRVFYAPNASIDTRTDEFSQQKFIDRTASKKGTYGDLLNYSAEMSEKRANQAGGVDPVKDKYLKDYSAKRKGAKHIDEMKKGFENKTIKVDYNK